MTAEEVIKAFNLIPLPNEGGFYRQTYKSTQIINNHPQSTAILYLITPTSFSKNHRIPQDEIFHFYLGDPVIQTLTLKDGSTTSRILGPNIQANHLPQALVPGGTWQQTQLKPGGTWSLLGCTCTPGWIESDLELAP